MPNACVFCGSTTSKITKEHVPADWVAALYPSDTMVQVEMMNRDGSLRAFQIPPFDQTVRVVCDDCNTGWMCELEGHVSPVLGPMIQRSQTTKIRPARARLLATWAVKTAFMFCQLHPARKVVPDSEYHRFYAVKQPPVGYVIWLAHRIAFHDSTGREALIAAREQEITTVTATDADSAEKIKAHVAEGRKAFRVTFAIGHIVFAVFGHNFLGKFTVNEPHVKSTQWIWPIQRGKVTWPASISVDKLGGLDALHKALGGEH